MKSLITKNDITLFKLIPTNISDERVTPYIVEAQQFDLLENLGAPLFYDLLRDSGNEIASIPYTGLTGAFQIGETVNVGAGKTAKVQANAAGILTLNTIIGLWESNKTITGQTSAATATSGNITFGKYYLLMNGESYVDPSGYQIDYQGLKPALIYWTFARFIENQQISITSHGVVEKTNDYSEQVSEKKIAYRITQARSGALNYFRLVEKYLCDKNTGITTYPLYTSYIPINKKSGGAKISIVDRFSKGSTIESSKIYSGVASSILGTVKYAAAISTIDLVYSYTLPELIGKTLVSVQLGSIMLSPDQYTLVGSVFTIIDVNVIITAGLYLRIGYQI